MSVRLVLSMAAIALAALAVLVLFSGPGRSQQGPGTYQGKSVRWWANRAVQARKDANARAQVIKRLWRPVRMGSAHFFDWLAAADCVRRREATWHHNGRTYDGGMQADHDFQRTWGREYYRAWGEAWRWPWYRQLEMAYRGWLFRGWQPWPTTARMCGLL